MHKPSTADASINDKDINALMANIHRMDKKKGLDLILHTPGGDLAATEQIIHYLRSVFNGDIRAVKGFDEPTRVKIREVFSQNSNSKIHNRHIDRDKCRDSGLDIIDLESDQTLQDLVLGIHHCCMILSEQSNILKIVENNIGGGYVVNMPIQPAMPAPIRIGKYFPFLPPTFYLSLNLAIALLFSDWAMSM